LRSSHFRAIIPKEKEENGGAMRKDRQENGQVLTEYAIMLVMFALVTITLFLLLAVFTEYGWRLIAFVSWEPWF